MDKKYDVVALGEVLIDFTRAGISADGQKLFEQNPGGAPANFLTAVAHFHKKTALIGKVGNDMHGLFLKSIIEAEGINTIGLLLDNNCFTTLAFVDLANNGERIFSFARKPGADTQLETKELPKQLLQNTKIFHIGSLSLTTDPARESTYFAMKIAKQAGAWISYDPNYRANLWPSQNAAVSEMRNMLRYSDMVKVSDEECILLTGEKNFEKGAQKILDEGATFVAVTLGKHGALIASKEGTRIVKGFAVESVDTTGAGDSFWGGLVSSFIESGKQLCDITLREWEEFATVGNAVAALCVGKRGGIPSIPTAESVNEFLKTKIQSL